MENLINFKQIVKYYAAGAVVNGFGYLFFLLLVSIGFGHKYAASMLYVIGVFVSYLLNRKFVFNSVASVNSGFVRLLLMLLGGYFLNISFLFIFVDIYGFRPGTIQLISIVLVSIYFYIINKFFVHGNSG